MYLRAQAQAEQREKEKQKEEAAKKGAKKIPTGVNSNPPQLPSISPYEADELEDALEDLVGGGIL